MTARKRKLIIYTAIVVIFVLLEIFFCLSDSRNTKVSDTFHNLTARILREELMRDSLSLHYSFADAGVYGMDETAARFRFDPLPGQDEEASGLHTYLEALSSIHPDSLSETDRRTYDQLYSYLQQAAALEKYPFLGDPLSPVSGIQNELPLLLNEYTLRDREDIECYFRLLEDIPDYFAGLCLYEKNKQEQGTFMSDRACDQIIAYCESVITSDALWHNAHFLQTGFNDRVQVLVDTSVITENEASAYTSRNTELLLHSLMPAYHSLADSLYLLKCDAPDAGLCHDPDGREYYTLLLRQKTCSSKSPEELLTQLTDRYDEIAIRINTLMEAYVREVSASRMSGSSVFAEDFYDLLINEPSMTLQSPDAMIQNLQEQIGASYPDLPNTPIFPGSGMELKEVVPQLQSVLAPALYITAPVDDLDTNVIYVNNPDSCSDIALYTTLAHEGFPGHLYQTVYSGLYASQKNADPIRCLLYYGGFTEGWAMYSEANAYTYAASLLDTSDISPKLARILTELYWNDRELQLCLMAMLDIQIHYHGATYQTVQEELSVFGITDVDVITTVYNYIIDDPGNYPMYYIGYLELLSLQDCAKELWQSEYTDLRFHEFLLQYGPDEFDRLRNKLTNGCSFV